MITGNGLAKPTCSLRESFTHLLLDRLKKESDDSFRKILIAAVQQHSRHTHAGESGEVPYVRSVPAGIEGMLPGMDRYEAGDLRQTMWSYAHIYPEVTRQLWKIVDDDPLHGSDTLGSLLRAAVRSSTEHRREVIERLNRYLLEAVGMKDRLVPGFVASSKIPDMRHELTVEERKRFEATLSALAIRDDLPVYSLDAVTGLVGFGSERAFELYARWVEIHGKTHVRHADRRLVYYKDPEFLARVVEEIRSKPLQTTAARTWTMILYFSGRGAESLPTLKGWIKSHSSEEVRAASLSAAIDTLFSLASDGNGAWEKLFGYARDLLAIVLEDPSEAVRREAAGVFRKIPEFMAYLDSETVRKVELLLKSVEDGKGEDER